MKSLMFRWARAETKGEKIVVVVLTALILSGITAVAFTACNFIGVEYYENYSEIPIVALSDNYYVSVSGILSSVSSSYEGVVVYAVNVGHGIVIKRIYIGDNVYFEESDSADPKLVMVYKMQHGRIIGTCKHLSYYKFIVPPGSISRSFNIDLN